MYELMYIGTFVAKQTFFQGKTKQSSNTPPRPPPAASMWGCVVLSPHASAPQREAWQTCLLRWAKTAVCPPEDPDGAQPQPSVVSVIFYKRLALELLKMNI